jgi:hypothetical protein
MKRTILIVAAIVAVAGVSLFGLRQGLRQIDCKKRNEAFSLRVEIVEQDAHKQLKVGSKKDDVTRFYTQHKIPFQVVWLKDVGFEAIGTLYTVGGCAPLGCGTNSALIGVRVRVDSDGTVTGEPEIVSMYTDCL